MFNDESSANFMTLLEDLETDLRNGNVPGAEKLIFTLVNFLTHEPPPSWKLLGAFAVTHLKDTTSRVALLNLLPKIKEEVCLLQPETEADQTS